MKRPFGVLKAVFNAPSWLYRHRLGWIFGRRILVVSHRGRRSGRQYETVLECVVFDKITKESVIASAYGTRADWYRNIRATPALRVRTGRLDYVPDQRFLTPDEARAAAARFCREHPLEARIMPRMLTAIGAAVPPGERDHVEMLAALPMVAFRPGSDRPER